MAKVLERKRLEREKKQREGLLRDAAFEGDLDQVVQLLDTFNLAVDTTDAREYAPKYFVPSPHLTHLLSYPAAPLYLERCYFQWPMGVLFIGFSPYSLPSIEPCRWRHTAFRGRVCWPCRYHTHPIGPGRRCQCARPIRPDTLVQSVLLWENRCSSGPGASGW